MNNLHTKHGIPAARRLCCICHEIEDGKQFLLQCSINAGEIEDFYAKNIRAYDDFTHLDGEEKLFTNQTCIWQIPLPVISKTQ